MLYSISSNEYSAVISDMGAELKSFKNLHSQEEYIWQGEANIWLGSAPILFPIVGRLKNGQYSFNDKKYQLDKHGIARKSVFSLVDDRESEKSFILVSNPDTELCYPFKFELNVGFKIESDHLQVSYSVKNTGADTLYFTLGSHPTFSLPVDQCRLEDYYIEFERQENLDCYLLENGLLSTNPIRSYLKDEKIISITKDLFNHDVLIFKNIQSQEISINNKKTGHRLILDCGNAPHLGIWSKPGATFVCLEPLFSHDDSKDTNGDLTKKSGIIKLNAGEIFNSGYVIKD